MSSTVVPTIDVTAVDGPELDRLRQRWRRLVERDLPEAARTHADWPVRFDHCFARIVLDHVYGRPWREALAPPAWRHMDRAALCRGIALAEAIEAGTVDLAALDARSLAWRGKAKGRHR